MRRLRKRKHHGNKLRVWKGKAGQTKPTIFEPTPKRPERRHLLCMQSKVKKGRVKCEHWKGKRKKDAKRVWYNSINAANREGRNKIHSIPPPLWHISMHFATLSSVYCCTHFCHHLHTDFYPLDSFLFYTGVLKAYLVMFMWCCCCSSCALLSPVVLLKHV